MSFCYSGKEVDFDLTRKIKKKFSWEWSLPLYESNNKG
jgi:hypothetical protein